MLVATKGIVFKSIKFQETSLIVKILTETHGLQTFMIKGVRSVKANGKAANFQSGMLLDLIMYYQDHKSFQSLREYKSTYIYTSVMDDIRKSCVLMFLIEVLSNCVQEDKQDNQLYSFIANSLINFDNNDFEVNFHLYFLLEFMKYLGIYPSGQRTQTQPRFSLKDGDFTSFSSSNPFILSDSQSILWNQLLHEEGLILNKEERKEVLNIILNYYTFHIENFKGIKSLKVLESILA